MEFLRRSMAWKCGMAIAVVFLIMALLDYFALGAAYDWLYEHHNIPLPILNLFPLLPLVLLFGFTLVVMSRIVFGPIGKVFFEMKAFLAARSYRKIFTSRLDEVGVLASFFNDITKKIEKAKTSVAGGESGSQQISVGRDIQRRILPIAMPVIPGIAVFGSTRPAAEVGGDSFDIISSGNNHFIYVGDVAGHGVPSTIIMTMVNSIMRSLSDVHQNGYDLLVNANRVLKPKIEPRKFMTCVLLRWNSSENKMYSTGAGHEHILIFRRKDSTCEARQTGGVALGMVPDISKIIKEESIPLENGDALLLYSDGIIEAKNAQGEMYGLERLRKAVSQFAGPSSPQEMVANISQDFGVFVGDQVPEDDITLIAIKRA